MTKVIREKYEKCIEWKVSTESSSTTFRSDTFLFMDTQCHLELTTGTFNKTTGRHDNNSRLNLKINEKLKTPARVSVSCHSDPFRQINPTTRGTSSITTSTCIWNYDYCYYGRLPHLLVFEVAIEADFSKSDPTVFTAACNALEETQKSMKSRKNTHFEALSRDFSKLLNESSIFDVKITCESKTFKAHRIVLETRSTVFAAMLKSDMVEGKTGTIKLEDITASIFENFLRYLYSGTHPDLSIDAAKQYYVAADKYAVVELKATCSEFLTKHLSQGNACEILVLADQHSDKSFRNDIISYIVKKKIPQVDKQWPHFCKKYPILAIEVLNLYIQKHCSESIQ